MNIPPIKIEENVLSVDFTKKSIRGDPKPNEPSMKSIAGPEVSFASEGVCKHINISVYDDLSEVQCRDCGKSLNPIWVLARMAKEETKWAYRRAEFIKAKDEYANRVRCKCQHCGKMTRI